jgi:integrase/recombinase XerD
MEMVRKYVNMYGEDLKENFEEFNPINQFINTRKEHIKLK